MKLHSILNNFNGCWLLLGIIGLSGCNDYLTVQPEDVYSQEQVFKSEKAVQQTLNGIYMSLIDNNLYGLQLTQYAVEYLGQQYQVSHLSQGLQTQLHEYNFNTTETASLFNQTWTKGYQTILETNNFIKSLNAPSTTSVLTQQRIDLLHGEAVAIRALLHFDLLRLFGPVYPTAPDQMSIPYYIEATIVPQPIISATDALALVIADFEAALDLLSNDPVLVNGVSNVGSIDFYSSHRNRRMNYFAVKGLLARAMLYGGHTEEARTLAKEVLEEGEKWFDWLPYTAIINAGQNPDRIFSTEVIFGLDNRNLYENQLNYFTTNTTAPTRANEERLEYTFEYNTNDYRYLTTWLYNTQNWRTFSKFADVQNTGASWRFLQPLLRKSELYYIIAETENDPNVAISYLNTVRQHRGLYPLDEYVDVNEEITKEYQKEFIGEGQLFFYYKRLDFMFFPDGNDVWNDIWEPNYVVPLPESETKMR